MSKLEVRTKGNSMAQGKSRVYISCHPDDFEFYFDSICEDIFKYQDCAVFYESDAESYFDDDVKSRLNDMQLFVFIVTRHFLQDKNCRSYAYEFKFAMENHIPVLPICVDNAVTGEYFSQIVELLGEGYGKIQLLNKAFQESSEIPYDEKLKNRLENVLVGDELAERIRAAFDAYIFMSYRKKDREYARRLMELIHRIPGCRDIAIWYDEYLVPGEEWSTAIAEAMLKSKLVTLAVTPSLLELPNYVASNEYVEARKNSKLVLPAELVSTELEELQRIYPGIEEPFNGNDIKELAQQLKLIAVEENDNNPEHNYLIGLAYLNGIDVEKNISRGLNIIKEAADNNCTEAIEKIVYFYFCGEYLEQNREKAIEYQKKLSEIYLNKYGKEHEKTLEELSKLANYYLFYDNEEGLKIHEEVYEIRRNYCGERHQETLGSKHDILFFSSFMSNPEDVIDEHIKLYEQCKKVLGAQHQLTIRISEYLCIRLSDLGRKIDGYNIIKEGYESSKLIYGEYNTTTLTMLYTMTNAYLDINIGANREDVIMRCRNTYEVIRSVLGEEHQLTINSLKCFQVAINTDNHCEEYIELYKNLYDTYVRIYGEENKLTIDTLYGMAQYMLDRLEKYEDALILAEKAYEVRRRMGGLECEETLEVLELIANCLFGLGRHKESIEKYEQIYELRQKINGWDHYKTIDTEVNIGYIYYELEKYEQALVKFKEAYTLRSYTKGDTYALQCREAEGISNSLFMLKRYKEALEFDKKIYEIQKQILGKNHENTQNSLNNIINDLEELGLFKEAQELKIELL